MYETTALPGMKSGVSGSIALVNSVGISKYIPQERIDASVEFIKYIASEDVQKELVIKNGLISAMENLYDDSEICQAIDCKMIHNILPFTTMDYSSSQFGNDYYRDKYIQYLGDYLFGNNVELMDMLTNVDNALSTYTLSLKTDDTVAGLILFLFITISMTTMGIFILLFSFKKITQQNKYVFWVLSAFGSIIVMSSIFTQYENITKSDCYANCLLISCGYCISSIPALYIALERKLKKRNSFDLEKYKYIFVFGLILVEVLLNILLIVTSSMDVETYVIPYGKNFKKCVVRKTFGIINYHAILIYMIAIAIALIILIFTEFNARESTLDIKLIITIIFANIIFFVFIFLINNIKINNYIAYYLLNVGPVYFISIINYFLIYGRKIIRKLIVNGVDTSTKGNSNSNNPTYIEKSCEVSENA